MRYEFLNKWVGVTTFFSPPYDLITGKIYSRKRDFKTMLETNQLYFKFETGPRSGSLGKVISFKCDEDIENIWKIYNNVDSYSGFETPYYAHINSMNILVDFGVGKPKSYQLDRLRNAQVIITDQNLDDNMGWKFEKSSKSIIVPDVFDHFGNLIELEDTISFVYGAGTCRELRFGKVINITPAGKLWVDAFQSNESNSAMTYKTGIDPMNAVILNKENLMEQLMRARLSL